MNSAFKTSSVFAPTLMTGVIFMPTKKGVSINLGIKFHQRKTSNTPHVASMVR